MLPHSLQHIISLGRVWRLFIWESEDRERMRPVADFSTVGVNARVPISALKMICNDFYQLD